MTRTFVVPRVFKAAVAAVILSVTLAACVSLSGTQTRIIDPRLKDGGLEGLAVRTALENFGSSDAGKRGQRTPREYRDYVVSIYLAAIDMNYAEFSTGMSSERRQLGLGIDLVTIGLTNYASVARQSIVNDLSAAASGFAGARGAIDRNVYLDRTVPVLVASMDAERARIQTRIEQGLAQPADVYTLHNAFRDLRLLEAAGSLDRALADITSQATEQRRLADEELATVVQACEVVDADVVDLNTRVSNFVDDLADASLAQDATDLAARTQALRQTGLLAGLQPEAVIGDPPGVASAIRQRLFAGLNGRCAAMDVQGLIERIRQQTGRAVQ